MGFFSDKCPECGAKVRRGASFCSACGTSAPKATAACPACGKEVKTASKYCGQCGAPLRSPESEDIPVDHFNRWSRAEDEFARRIEATDLHGMLKRGLVVEPGTQALIFQGGHLAAMAGAGTYHLNRPLEQVDTASPATAILIDAGETILKLLYRNVRTQEDVAVDATVQVVVQLADAAALHANLMHGRESLSISDLARLLWSESANVIQARVKQESVKQLDANLELKTALEDDLRENISTALGRNGLQLVQLRFVQFSSEAYDKVRDKRAETSIAEEKLDDTQHRVALRQRLRETLTRDRMDKFTSAKDFEEFVRQTEHELGMKD
ncbi:MAG: zinc-ribbon domain-containing protein, partial [Pirellulales bacterium]